MNSQETNPTDDAAKLGALWFAEGTSEDTERSTPTEVVVELVDLIDAASSRDGAMLVLHAFLARAERLHESERRRHGRTVVLLGVSILLLVLRNCAFRP